MLDAACSSVVLRWWDYRPSSSSGHHEVGHRAASRACDWASHTTPWLYCWHVVFHLWWTSVIDRVVDLRMKWFFVCVNSVIEDLTLLENFGTVFHKFAGNPLIFPQNKSRLAIFGAIFLNCFKFGFPKHWQTRRKHCKTKLESYATHIWAFVCWMRCLCPRISLCGNGNYRNATFPVSVSGIVRIIRVLHLCWYDDLSSWLDKLVSLTSLLSGTCHPRKKCIFFKTIASTSEKEFARFSGRFFACSSLSKMGVFG